MKQLTEKQIRQLNNIGFIWDPTTFVWEKHFKALKQFKEKNGKHKWPSRNYKHTIIYEDGNMIRDFVNIHDVVDDD